MLKSAKSSSVSSLAATTITEIILLIGILTLLFIIEPISTLIVFSLLLFIGIIFFYFSKTKMKKWGEDKIIYYGENE